jgi:hypothetical protein
MFLKRLSPVPLLLILSLFLIAARPLQAPAGDVLIYVQLAVAAFAALIGWPALLSVLVIAAQYFGWLSLAASETFIFWANVLVFGGIFVLALLGKIDLVNQIDSTFGTVAQLVTYVLILLGVPMAFERTQATQERFRATRFYQARVLSRAK